MGKPINHKGHEGTKTRAVNCATRLNWLKKIKIQILMSRVAA